MNGFSLLTARYLQVITTAFDSTFCIKVVRNSVKARSTYFNTSIQNYWKDVLVGAFLQLHALANCNLRH